MLFLNEDTKYIEKGDSEWGVFDQSVYDMDLLAESMGIPEGFYGEYFDDNPIIMGYEMLSEMNSGWNALEKDMLLCEAHAVIQGIPLDENAFTDKMKSWWQAIKNFFTKIWAGIKDFFRKVWVAISSKFQKAERWWATHKSEITESRAEGISGYTNLLKLDKSLDSISAGLKDLESSPSDSKEGYEEALQKLDDDDKYQKDSLRTLVFGEKVEDLTVTVSDVTVYFNNLAKISKTLVNFQNNLAKNSQEAIKTAEQGMKEAQQEQAEKLTAKIKYLKKKNSIYQEVVNLVASAASQSTSLYYTAAKKLYILSKRGK